MLFGCRREFRGGSDVGRAGEIALRLHAGESREGPSQVRSPAHAVGENPRRALPRFPLSGRDEERRARASRHQGQARKGRLMMAARPKITVVGAGNVGASVAQYTIEK